MGLSGALTIVLGYRIDLIFSRIMPNPMVPAYCLILVMTFILCLQISSDSAPVSAPLSMLDRAFVQIY
jgi:hypothetical protein